MGKNITLWQFFCPFRANYEQGQGMPDNPIIFEAPQMKSVWDD